MARSYAALAPVYDRLLGAHGGHVISFVEDAIARHRPGAARLVDVGCGPGALLEHFAAGGLEVRGYDRSPAMVRAARARLDRFGDRARVIRGDLLALPTSLRADVVTATLEVVNHLPGPAELERFLRRVRRTLVPGGIVWLDASTATWFRGLWSRSREVASGDARTRWEGRWSERHRTGVMTVRVQRDGAEQRDEIRMRALEVRTVERAMQRAGLAVAEKVALVGVRVGPRTGRVGYVGVRAG